MNWNILGHDWIVSLLKEHTLRGRIRHAYMFTGPQGVGRRTLALRFAQAINCSMADSNGEPCMQCSICLRIDRMQHPDLLVIQSESDSKVLKVDQVRTLQHALSLSPYEARYKIGLDTPTNPINNYDTTATVAAGSTDNHDTADFGAATKKVSQIVMGASVPLKGELQYVDNSVGTTLAVFFTPAGTSQRSGLHIVTTGRARSRVTLVSMASVLFVPTWMLLRLPTFTA